MGSENRSVIWLMVALGEHQKVWGSRGKQLLRLTWEAVLVDRTMTQSTPASPVNRLAVASVKSLVQKLTEALLNGQLSVKILPSEAIRPTCSGKRPSN
jgi:hypothetical protein